MIIYNNHIQAYKRFIWENIEDTPFGEFIKSNKLDFKQVRFLWRLKSEMGARIGWTR